MTKYTAKEIEKFLKTIDSYLEKKVEIILIGGTAAALAYKVKIATQDIDTWNSVASLMRAYNKAKKETGLEIPLSRSSVADAPLNFEDRLKTFKPKQFKKLVVKVPSVIDLILMKTLRGYEHDLEAIEEMVKSQKVKFPKILEIYVSELGAAIGDKRKLDLNFLAMIERCYSKSNLELARTKLNF